VPAVDAPAAPAGRPGRRRRRGPARLPALAPVLLSGALAGAWLALDPPSTDGAAHAFRTGLWEREGPTAWSNAWYAGHHTPGYSVLFPPLAALLDPRVVAALAAVTAAALFDLLARERWGERARPGSLWLAAGTATMLLSGRLPFALGVALGLAAAVALQRRRPAAACGLGVAAGLASPVAGLFLALGGVALAAASPGWRRGGALLAAAAAGPVGLLALGFPEGGVEPFVASAFWPIPLLALAGIVLLPARERALRAGLLLYAAAATAAFLIDSPMGGNAARLGALFGGPVLAAALWPPARRDRRGILVAAAVALPLLYWQWTAAVRDVVEPRGDPSVHAEYHQPLLDFLAARTDGPRPPRIEIPFTRHHWEAAHVAPSYPLARGWQRQLDLKVNRLFYEPGLTPARFERWLRERGVSYVALPDVPLDYSARAEAALVRRGQPFLREVWRGEHWRVWAVAPEPGLVEPPGRLERLEAQAVEVTADRPGRVLVRVRFSRHWALTEGAGCVRRGPAGLTELELRRPGRARLSMRPSPGRLVASGPRCTAGRSVGGP
jgi:hypothetical protein